MQTALVVTGGWQEAQEHGEVGLEGGGEGETPHRMTVLQVALVSMAIVMARPSTVSTAMALRTAVSTAMALPAAVSTAMSLPAAVSMAMALPETVFMATILIHGPTMPRPPDPPPVLVSPRQVTTTQPHVTVERLLYCLLSGGRTVLTKVVSTGAS